MKKENKIHLEGAKVYGPQDYEVVDELKNLKEENEKLKEDRKTLESAIGDLVRENRRLKEQRIFSSDEYDLITLTSTTPKWELRRK